jgi:protein-L-isoaspartate(D-aspartate) O-methyltransferase
MRRLRRCPQASLALAALLAALPGSSAVGQDQFAGLRQSMVDQQIRARQITDPQVLAAMAQVPRHEFVPTPERAKAYSDQPLRIGHQQTISQPYMVALMTALAGLDGDDRVLEVGTGSGYHAAVLSRVAGEVYSIEIVPELAEQARATLARLGYDNVHVRQGDGYQGWPEKGRFDAVVLTAAPPRVPLPLLDQLKPWGRMVVPVGEFMQDLLVITKRPDGTIETRKVLPVRFVPMTGLVQSAVGTEPPPS